jgi:hypothetical protein
VKFNGVNCAFKVHALIFEPDKWHGGAMIPNYKTASSNYLMGMTGAAFVAMVSIWIFAATGCAAVVDHSSVRISAATEMASSACPQNLNSDWRTSPESAELSDCPPQFPSGTIYRNEEANLLNTAAWQTSNDSQSGLFTPVWVIF